MFYVIAILIDSYKLNVNGEKTFYKYIFEI